MAGDWLSRWLGRGRGTAPPDRSPVDPIASLERALLDDRALMARLRADGLAGHRDRYSARATVAADLRDALRADAGAVEAAWLRRLAAAGPTGAAGLDWRLRRALREGWSGEAGNPRRPLRLAIDLCHASGRRREGALIALGAVPVDPTLAPLILLRLNDWVGPVREAAWTTATGAAGTAPLGWADAIWPMLPQAEGWSRGRARLHALALAPTIRPAIAEALRAASAGRAPSALRALTLREDALDAFLPVLATAAVQPGVRAVALTMLLEGGPARVIGTEPTSEGSRIMRPVIERRPLAVAPPPGLVGAALADGAAAPRRALLDAAIGGHVAIPGEALARLGTDRRPSIRERVDFLARRMGITSA